MTPPLTYIRTSYVWQTIPFFDLHSSPINLSPFSTRSDHFEKFDPCTKGHWPFTYFSLYLDNETSYGYHVIDFFYSLWLAEGFEICFNLIGVFLSFIPILPLTLDSMVKMVFEKLPGIFIWKFGPSFAFWYVNFQILIKWERVFISRHIGLHY